jgi:hypothetical protein
MRPSIPLLLIAVSILGVVHYLALSFSLYWEYPWFDMPVHALGGACAALSLFVLSDLGVPLPHMALRPVAVVCFALGVGVVWECFELYAGIAPSANYALDTSLDLLMDVLGGAIGYLVGSRMRRL